MRTPEMSSAAISAPAPEPSALEAEAARAMQAGEFARAAGLLEQALAQSSPTLSLHLGLAAIRRRTGDLGGALASVDGALTLSPRDFVALLTRASLLERKGQGAEAATAYGHALGQAPPALDGLDPPTRRAALHAREVYDRHQADMAAFLHEKSRAALERCSGPEARRAAALIEDLLGRRKRYRQEPSSFFYPGLPAIEFYDREAFDWIEALEASTDAIAAELAAVVTERADGFVPYVDYDESLPLDQWRALNRSPDWSAFHLYRNGAPVERNCARCPATVAALARTPQPQLGGRSPAAMFSVLKPHTHIPPHTGVSNTRLVVHLPLIVPPACRFRVGNETREWVRGRAWVFDDTLEHEAFNDSGQDRIILIFDIVQPALSPAEQAAIAAVTQALDVFRGAPVDAKL